MVISGRTYSVYISVIKMQYFIIINKSVKYNKSVSSTSWKEHEKSMWIS